jgi:tRNA-guanine family transglycosylase
MLVLDECTSPLHDVDYTENAMRRTHRWAERALRRYRELGIRDQAVYAIVQGGAYRELREASARFVGGLDSHGIAIGGSLGKSKRDMLDVLEWSEPHLPPEKPRHLLGIGEVEDVFDVVARGVDTFDCVTPTRYGRYGTALVRGEPKFRLNLTSGRFRTDPAPIAADCDCPTTCSRPARCWPRTWSRFTTCIS